MASHFNGLSRLYVIHTFYIGTTSLLRIVVGGCYNKSITMCRIRCLRGQAGLINFNRATYWSFKRLSSSIRFVWRKRGFRRSSPISSSFLTLAAVWRSQPRQNKLDGTEAKCRRKRIGSPPQKNATKKAAKTLDCLARFFAESSSSQSQKRHLVIFCENFFSLLRRRCQEPLYTKVAALMDEIWSGAVEIEICNL